MKILKSAFKFIFSSVPKGLIGTNQLSQGNSVIKTLLINIKNPVCPNCNKGVLLENKKEIDTTYTCNKCSYSVVSEKEEIHHTISKVNREKYKNLPLHDNEGEIKKILMNHIYTSRVFFFLSLMSFLYSCYLIVIHASWMDVLNALSISLIFVVYGMKRSYRAWQVLSGNLFIPGSFLRWLQNEKWLI